MVRRGASAATPAALLDPTPRAGSVSGAPTKWDYVADRAFRALAQAAVWAILLLLALILWEIAGKAWPGIREHGLGALTSRTWNASQNAYGFLPEIWGTLYSSLLALLVGGFFGVAMAIFLTQDFLPRGSPRSSGPSSSCWPPFPAWCTACGASSWWCPPCARWPTGSTRTSAGSPSSPPP